MQPSLPVYFLGAMALLLGLAGFARRASRWAWWIAAVLAASAALTASRDDFWSSLVLSLFALAAAIKGFQWLDSGWRTRFGLVLGVTLLGGVCLWPTLSDATDGALPCPELVRRHVTFRLVAGLDLRGGLRLVYTVEADEALQDRRDHHYEDMRTALAKLFELHTGDTPPSEEVYTKLRERVNVSRPRDDVRAIILTFENEADLPKLDDRFLAEFGSELSYSREGKSYLFRLRSSVENQIRDKAVGQAREIIQRRVDELGLREAAVSTRQEDIIVEVPGQDESSFARIREIISQTARLEFKLVDDETDVLAPLRAGADKASFPEGLEFFPEEVSLGLDADGNRRKGVATYAYLKIGANETAPQALERLRTWGDSLALPPDREFGYQVDYDADPVTQKSKEVGYRTYLLKSRVELSGDQIRDAQAQPNTSQNSLGGWYVALRFTDAGGTSFERITGANVQKRFAILLDNRVESAPVIQTRIAGGNATITLGSSDPETQLRDARKLELVLRSGALPAPITPTNEQSIGPSLGQDSIQLGVRGAVMGAVVVLAFMLAYYRRAGLIADVAVTLNIVLLLAVMASFGASMTLPGIAGLALTVGMSVDSNVLITERIREELRQGRSPRAAVDLGYDKAFSAIVDGQLTTLISAIVMAQFGTGPIKGFAVTLMVGVATSIFTGVTVSRVLFDLWVRSLSRTSKLDVG